jgi:hypothetical protein
MIDRKLFSSSDQYCGGRDLLFRGLTMHSPNLSDSAECVIWCIRHGCNPQERCPGDQ